MTTDGVVLWRGKLVAEMTRDELHDAFQELALMAKRQQVETERQFSVLAEMRAARTDADPYRNFHSVPRDTSERRR